MKKNKLLILIPFLISCSNSSLEIVKTNKNLIDDISINSNNNIEARKNLNLNYSQNFIFEYSFSYSNNDLNSKCGVLFTDENSIFEYRFEFDNKTNEYVSKTYRNGSNLAKDLGDRFLINDNDGNNITIIYNENLFYVAINGILKQTRKFESYPLCPTLYVNNASANFKNIKYNTNINDIIEKTNNLKSQYNLLTYQNNYANYNAYKEGNNSLLINKLCNSKGFSYSLVGLKGEYSNQDILVEFNISNISYDVNLINKNIWPKIGLVSYHDLGYLDYICFGSGPYQDRIETYFINAYTQWHNHIDITGDNKLSETINSTKKLNFKIYISNFQTNQVYRVYVNNALVGVRTAHSYSKTMRFGFASDYASGLISDISIKEGVTFYEK